ncbi:serine-rich adhesin for platelets-like [Biomphalaria glabrata]|uniref:Serine-rich adhesin for platelets-like n=1 Tax=Biomphalaria glabrata TaxID=6526 RepID=A0A9W2Z9F2_BIOGL|nr:serine-rich adhesin for platelets-like [Biomphalaria glabrata]
MSSIFLLLLCLHALECNVAAFSQEVSVSLMSETFSSRHRARRDATPSPVMPDEIIFQMTLQGKSVVLRLTKSNLLPVVTDDVETTLQANKVPEDSAVYTDAAHGSTFIVHRNNGSYSLKGTFSESDASWSLEPLQQEAASKRSQKHQAIRRLDSSTIQYGSDAILDKKERPELIFSKKLYRHPGHRQRRAANRHVIEVAFIVDYVDYQKFVALYGQTDALIRMRLWYTSVADALKAMYESITDPDISITTSVTILKILTTTAADAFIANITTNGQFIAGSGLDALVPWVQLQADLPLSDHYMLFTGRDSSVPGVAFVAAACTSLGVSVIKNEFSGMTAQIAAHELGHSISAAHDSLTEGLCDDADQYIMTDRTAIGVQPGNEGKPWKFSNCSISKFKSYLASKNCTRPEYTSNVDMLPAPIVGQRAGEVLSKDDQCRLALNYPRSSYYAGSAEEQARLCSAMWCFSPLGEYIITLVRPLAYTSCGTNMICLQGFCVPVQQVTTPVSITTTTPTTTKPTTSTTTKPTTTSTTTKPTTTSTTTKQTSTSTTTKPTTTSTTTKPTTTSTTTKPTTTSTTTKPTTTSTTTKPTTTSTTTKPTTTSTTTKQTSTTIKPSTKLP